MAGCRERKGGLLIGDAGILPLRFVHCHCTRVRQTTFWIRVARSEQAAYHHRDRSEYDTQYGIQESEMGKMVSRVWIDQHLLGGYIQIFRTSISHPLGLQSGKTANFIGNRKKAELGGYRVPPRCVTSVQY